MNTKTIVLFAALSALGAFADGVPVQPRSVEQIKQELSAFTNLQDKVAYKKAITTEEWRGIANAMIAVAGDGSAVSALDGALGISFSIGNEWSSYPNATALASEYDAKFAAAGIAVRPVLYKNLPLSCEVWFNSTNKNHVVYNQSHPLRISATRRIKNGDMSLRLLSGFGEWVNIMVEDASAMNTNGFVYGYCPDLAKKKKQIMQVAVKIVKTGLRKQGKSFVVQPDGKNPVQNAVDELIAALDAPKMQGVGAWMTKWCPDYTWIEPAWISDDAVNAYKEKIFLGDKQFTEEDKYHLCAYLGVTEYNKFVREYNGDGAK